MIGHHTHSHLVGNQEHKTVLDSELVDKELGVSCKSREMQGDCLLIKRSSDHRVQIPVPEILHSLRQGDQSRIGTFRGGLTGIDAEIIRHAVDDIDPLGMKILGCVDDIGIKAVRVRQLLLVETEGPRRAVYDRNADIKQTGISQGLDYDLIAHSVGIFLSIISHFWIKMTLRMQNYLNLPYVLHS